MNEKNKIFVKQHSRLKSIPEFDPNIVKLDLRRNEIQKLDFPFSETLIEVDLSDNKIKKISNLELLPNLRYLDLSYNLLDNIEIPDNKIEELYLICNDITKIDKINFKYCKIIDLAVNDITKIENLDSCENLKQLYLGNNKIDTIPDLKFLSKLEILDLQSNNLTSLDCNLLPLSLKQLLLSDNKKLKTLINYERMKNLKLIAVERTLIKDIFLDIEIWK